MTLQSITLSRRRWNGEEEDGEKQIWDESKHSLRIVHRQVLLQVRMSGQQMTKEFVFGAPPLIDFKMSVVSVPENVIEHGSTDIQADRGSFTMGSPNKELKH